MQRAGRAALKQVGAIQTEIQQSAVVYSDETGSRSMAETGGNGFSARRVPFCMSFVSTAAKT